MHFTREWITFHETHGLTPPYLVSPVSAELQAMQRIVVVTATAKTVTVKRTEFKMELAPTSPPTIAIDTAEPMVPGGAGGSVDASNAGIVVAGAVGAVVLVLAALALRSWGGSSKGGGKGKGKGGVLSSSRVIPDNTGNTGNTGDATDDASASSASPPPPLPAPLSVNPVLESASNSPTGHSQDQDSSMDTVLQPDLQLPSVLDLPPIGSGGGEGGEGNGEGNGDAGTDDSLTMAEVMAVNVLGPPPHMQRDYDETQTAAHAVRHNLLGKEHGCTNTRYSLPTSGMHGVCTRTHATTPQIHTAPRSSVVGSW